MTKRFAHLVLALLAFLSFCGASSTAQDMGLRPPWTGEAINDMTNKLVGMYGENIRTRAVRGLGQVADFWRPEDGGREEFERFVSRNFAGNESSLDTMVHRFERILEAIDGHMNEIVLTLREQMDLDYGPIMPYDEVFGAYDPSAHMAEDFFENKLSFVVLLNFPATTLEERLAEGKSWSRRQWAEARLAQRFTLRVPADVNQAISQAAAVADQYIADYNIWMHHLLDNEGKRIFPAKLRLLSHWNLRDEIKANYSLQDRDLALARQRMIQKVMEHIVLQTIPEQVVNNPHVDWNPYANEVTLAKVNDSGTEAPAGLSPSNAREPDTRYRVLQGTFDASRKLDPYSPTAPTLIARRFDEDREIPEARVREMLTQLVSSPMAAQVGKLIQERLGRPLEPFDIWYNGFKARGTYSEEKLDEIVSTRYPTPKAYRDDIPNLLVKLGFSEEKASYLSEYIVVDPARGSGHAWGGQMRGAKAHLRTRVEPTGMNYKGYNIAVHEMGHNVEQVFSMNQVDYTLLEGVPNTAFTEALAFVFQGRDLELLGLSTPDAKTLALETLNDFWGTYEIAGVALVDIDVWHWMYDHPDASPAELRDATVAISKNIWNLYYAPVFGRKDVVLPGIYSHMIHSFLYLPDYPIGHLIAHQIEEQMERAGDPGSEFERMATFGSVVPDLWMINAAGAPVGPDALLHATEKALKDLQ